MNPKLQIIRLPILKTAIFIATPIKNIFSSPFCQFVDRKVVGLMPKYLLEIPARFLFFSLHKIQISQQQVYPLNYLLHIGLMLAISKVFTILCQLCLCDVGISDTQVAFKPNQSAFFQMNAPVYSVLGQTESRRKSFLLLTSIDLSSKLCLTCVGNSKYYISVHHSIPTLLVEIGNTLVIFKQISKLAFHLSASLYSLLGQIEGGEEELFWRVQEGGSHCEITSKSTWLS